MILALVEKIWFCIISQMEILIELLENNLGTKIAPFALDSNIAISGLAFDSGATKTEGTAIQMNWWIG
jgi:hypothetical protein